jgi:hypothetical protein
MALHALRLTLIGSKIFKNKPQTWVPALENRAITQKKAGAAHSLQIGGIHATKKPVADDRGGLEWRFTGAMIQAWGLLPACTV